MLATTPRVARRHASPDDGDSYRRIREARVLRNYVREPCQRNLETLVVEFQPLARALAYRYRSRREPIEDLIQVANVGLVKAAKAYEPDRGSRFVSYAVPTILGELRRHFRDRVGLVRLPRSLQERRQQLEAMEAELTTREGRPSRSQLCRALDWSAAELDETLQGEQSRFVASLDAPVVGQGANEDIADVYSFIGSEDSGYDAVEARLATRHVHLDARDRAVLRMQFVDGISQREIGTRIGVSQMQVSRISRRALRCLLAAVRGEPELTEAR